MSITINAGLKSRIIVCLDIANGRVVKGVNFVNIKDMGCPIELACEYERQGADEIVFLDINATQEQRSVALTMVNKVADTLSIPFTVGGGLNSLNDVNQYLNAGADKVSLNSAAIKEPDLINQIANNFGSQSLCVAVDSKKDSNGIDRVFANGGREVTQLQTLRWLSEVESRGAGEILLTSIDKDGTNSGFDNELLALANQNSRVQLIASGGASSPHHFLAAFQAGADAVLAAGMFHRKEYEVSDVKTYLSQNRVNIRQ